MAKNPRATPGMLEEIYDKNLRFEKDRLEADRSNHEMRKEVMQAVQLRSMVLSNPNAGPELLEKALRDPRRNLRIKSIQHIRSTLKMLQKGLKDKMAIVAKAAVAEIAKRGLTLTGQNEVVRPVVAEEKSVSPIPGLNDTPWLMPDSNEGPEDHLYAQSGPSEAPAEAEGIKF